MSLVADPEPDQSVATLFIGQDKAGHWLVQESGGHLEGRFISFDAAMGFARAERCGFRNARIAVVATPLIPQISFTPAAPWERALRSEAQAAPVEAEGRA